MLKLVKVWETQNNASGSYQYPHYALLDDNFNIITHIEYISMDTDGSLNIKIYNTGYETHNTEDLNKFISDKKVESL